MTMRASNYPYSANRNSFASVESVLEDVRKGKMIIVCDDEEREAEGDLIMAAELVAPKDVAFMAAHGRGLICLPMDPAMVERLGLPDMVGRNEAPSGRPSRPPLTPGRASPPGSPPPIEPAPSAWPWIRGAAPKTSRCRGTSSP